MKPRKGVLKFKLHRGEKRHAKRIKTQKGRRS